MATPPQKDVETFMGITGASEEVAVQRLQVHGGDLNEAVNAYFSEGDNVLPRPERIEAHQPDWMDVDDNAEIRNPLDPFTSINRFRLPSTALIGRMPFGNLEPFVSHPRNVRNIPIESNDDQDQIVDRNTVPVIEELPASVNTQGAEIRGTVILDDDDLPSTASSIFQSSGYPHGRDFRPSAPQVMEEPMVSNDEGNDIEEEMLQAVIEASRREAEEANRMQQHGRNEDQIRSRVDQTAPRVEDDEFERALSLSLKTAEQEKALREREGVVGLADSTIIGTSSQLKLDTSTEQQHKTIDGFDAGPLDETEDPDEQPLLRRRSLRRTMSGTAETAADIGQELDGPVSSPVSQSVASAPQHNGDPFHEWGGISSQEHDEAVMLEAALFGGISHESAYQFSYPNIGVAEPYRRPIPRPPSPTLEAQRMIREQQDEELLASLQADQEKAEARRMEEEVAREAAAAEKKRQQEEELRRLQEQEESERQLEAKKLALPPEPTVEDENAVTLLVRMPDGSRRGRRFLKTDRLQSLFDFMDVGGGVRPGTYRLVVASLRIKSGSADEYSGTLRRTDLKDLKYMGHLGVYWDALVSNLGALNTVNAQNLQQLHTLKFKPNKKLESFVQREAKLRVSLLALGEEVIDTSLIPIILRALPPYRIFVMTLNLSDQIVNFDKLVNLLQQEEAMYNKDDEEEHALSSHHKGNGKSQSSQKSKKQHHYNEEDLKYKLMDSKTRKVYTNGDVDFFEKNEVENPSPDSPNVDISPVVKIEVDVPMDDDNDDGNDGDDQTRPRPTGIVQYMHKWYTNMIQDAKMDAPPDTSTTGPQNRSKA
ncbi:hypothetical protein KI387_000396 [Taxus chinensis]|uniref:UBX domain-containing protein n=1 Tax=Taxus chinensis TaxID=29808 RepID=A0AA38GU06_TAXCH|nr:hypothetical protein KI387_000396 [Taxus chinensis]